MLVSVVQQSESAICIHISPYPLHLKPPSHLPYPTSLGNHKAPNWSPCEKPFIWNVREIGLMGITSPPWFLSSIPFSFWYPSSLSWWTKSQVLTSGRSQRWFKMGTCPFWEGFMDPPEKAWSSLSRLMPATWHLNKPLPLPLPDSWLITRWDCPIRLKGIRDFIQGGSSFPDNFKETTNQKAQGKQGPA